MRLRPVWIFSAILFLLIGGLTTWVALTIPNDVRAEAILRKARNDLRDGKRDASREQLRTLVKRYPRTDAAATAAETLFQMQEQDVARLEKELAQADRESTQLAQRLANVEKKLATPPPAPKPTTVSKPKPVKKAPAKKTAKKTTRRRARRR